MSNIYEEGRCKTTCWAVAAAIGVLALLLAMSAGGRSFIAALFLGILATVLLGLLLNWLFCAAGRAASTDDAPGAGVVSGDMAGPASVEPAASVAARTAERGDMTAGQAAASSATAAAAGAATAVAATGAAPAAPQSEPEPEAPARDAAEQSGSAVRSSAAQAGEAEPAGRKGSRDHEGGSDSAASSEASAEPVAETEAPETEMAARDTGPEAQEDGAPVSAAEAPETGSVIKPSTPLPGQAELAGRKGSWRYQAEGDVDGDGTVAGTEAGSRPKLLAGPRYGQGDDLKQIKGIGPKLEAMCHRLGIYHFDQIAAWTPDEVAWVDANLEGFNGRVSRDRWIEQAKALAAG